METACITAGRLGVGADERNRTSDLLITNLLRRRAENLIDQ